MPTPTSKGVFVKPRRAWNTERMAGADWDIAGSAGNFRIAILFNDSAPSIDLGVYGLSLWQGTAGSVVVCSTFFGLPPGAALFSSGNPLVAGGPEPPGSFYTLTQAAEIGTRLFEFGGPTQWFFELGDTPMVILPPRWSLLMFPAFAGQPLVAGAIWGPV